MSMMGNFPGGICESSLPSLHPLDLLVGLCCGAGLRLAVIICVAKRKKVPPRPRVRQCPLGAVQRISSHFKHQNLGITSLLTKTERLMMNSRPADPPKRPQQNVLIVGGSGSSKTRFWIKPNLLQMHSSYVLTDPKGTTILEVGNAFVAERLSHQGIPTPSTSKVDALQSPLPTSTAGRIF